MAEWRRPETQPEAYRQLPDPGARAARYRYHWIAGKGGLLFLTFAGLMMAGGLNIANDGALWWLFLFPAATLTGLLWKGFPAFCRCPECGRRMSPRLKGGRVLKEGEYFNTVGPNRQYLVCDRCRLYLFLGERGI